MTPRLRRALHDALDLVLDALEEDGRGRVPRRRKRAEKIHIMPDGVDELTRERAKRAAERAGYTG
jgi:hypothetical protein